MSHFQAAVQNSLVVKLTGCRIACGVGKQPAGFFPVTSPKGKPFPVVFGRWLVLTWVSTGLEPERSCKHTAQSPASGEQKGAQGEEKEGEEQRENAQCVSVLMAPRPSPRQGCLEQMGRDSLTPH